jgi:hypothetical protein
MSSHNETRRSQTVSRRTKGSPNLSIAFPHDADDYYSQAVDLADVMLHNKGNLVSLDLQHFETSERFITDLLQRNVKSLKILGLHNMYLSPQGSWVKILSTFWRDNHCLRSVKFGGELCDSVYVDTMDSPNGAFEYGIEDGWDFNNDNKDFSKALEKYVISGGPYPLRHNDKRAVKEGLHGCRRGAVASSLKWSVPSSRRCEREVVHGKCDGHTDIILMDICTILRQLFLSQMRAHIMYTRHTHPSCHAMSRLERCILHTAT